MISLIYEIFIQDIEAENRMMIVRDGRCGRRKSREMLIKGYKVFFMHDK
jgi:predicted metalloprotease